MQQRIIPVLLLDNDELVKTKTFSDPTYIGDPINALKIFNEKEVDEIVVLDISASSSGKEPNYALIREMANECFIPLAYGGGITHADQAMRIVRSGVEKIILNTAFYQNPALVSEVSKKLGASSTVVSLDVKSLNGTYRLFTGGAKKPVPGDLSHWINTAIAQGVGEVMVQSIDRDGMYTGYDLNLLRKVLSLTNVPVIISGGAAAFTDFSAAFSLGAGAAAAGSLFVYYTRTRGILINYPDAEELKTIQRR